MKLPKNAVVAVADGATLNLFRNTGDEGSPSLTATTPGDAFLAAVAPILVAAGPLPHARLDTGSETTRPKKQATRLLKCECEACGYTVRTARKWLETVGAPLCPVDGHGPMRHDLLDSGDDAEP